MKKAVVGLLFLWVVCLLVGCTDEKANTPNVSEVEIETAVVRFDSMLYAMQSVEDLFTVQSRYPSFSQLYFNEILQLRNTSTPDSLYAQIRSMVDSETFQVLGRMGHNQYDDISDIKQDWVHAMKLYQYYFEPKTIPDLYTTLTEFAFGSFIFPVTQDKDGVGVSVDMFLGDSINYTLMAKTDPSFSSYNARTFNRDHLIKKAMDPLIDDLLPPARSAEFLPHLIREGKTLYISSKLLPFKPDTVMWEYTPAQLSWVKDNEWNIYSFLVTNELFFSKDRSKYIRLITAAPSTPDMPPESPGRAVLYVGYKIIERYMERHPNTTVSELVDIDPHALFQAAKYKPRR